MHVVCHCGNKLWTGSSQDFIKLRAESPHVEFKCSATIKVHRGDEEGNETEVEKTCGNVITAESPKEDPKTE